MYLSSKHACKEGKCYYPHFTEKEAEMPDSQSDLHKLAEGLEHGSPEFQSSALISDALSSHYPEISWIGETTKEYGN